MSEGEVGSCWGIAQNLSGMCLGHASAQNRKEEM